MTTSKLDQKLRAKEFKIGDLVRLTNQESSYGFVLMVTDRLGTTFSGTVVWKDTHARYIIGHNSSDWVSDMFEPYLGNVILNGGEDA
jgi:hypothetical protein